MKHNAFTTQLLKEIRLQSGGTIEPEVQELTRNNGVKSQAIAMRRKDQMVTPVIRLDHYLAAVRDGMGPAELAACMLNQVRQSADTGVYAGEMLEDFDSMKAYLGCRLISYEANAERLKQMPHRKWQDLAVIYVCQVPFEPNDYYCMEINGGLLEEWKLDEERLFEAAWERVGRPELYKIDDLGSLLEKAGLPSANEMETGKTILVLTNQESFFGAIGILLPEIREKLAERLGGDYFIIPSSVHECLVMPAHELADPDRLNRMIREINENELEPQEILADHAYRYYAESGTVEALF